MTGGAETEEDAVLRRDPAGRAASGRADNEEEIAALEKAEEDAGAGEAEQENYSPEVATVYDAILALESMFLKFAIQKYPNT